MSTPFGNQSDPVYIDFTDEFGEQWKGEFCFKLRLSALDQLTMDQVRRRYLGDAPGEISANAHQIAMACGQLSVLVVKAPEWWGPVKGGGPADKCSPTVLDHVLGVADGVLQKHREQHTKRAEAARTELRKQAPEPKAE